MMQGSRQLKHIIMHSNDQRIPYFQLLNPVFIYLFLVGGRADFFLCSM